MVTIAHQGEASAAGQAQRKSHKQGTLTIFAAVIINQLFVKFQRKCMQASEGSSIWHVIQLQPIGFVPVNEGQSPKHGGKKAQIGFDTRSLPRTGTLRTTLRMGQNGTFPSIQSAKAREKI